MGRFYPGVIGEVNGKLGGIVIRSMNHKKFYSVRPPNYKKSSNKAALLTRNNFSAAATLAKFLTGITELKLIWKSSSYSGVSVYHKILKANIKHVKKGLLSENCIVIPSSNYYFFPNFSFVDDKVMIVIGKIDSRLTLFFSKKPVMHLIFLLFNKINENEEKYTLNHYSAKIEDVSIYAGNELTIYLPENIRRKIGDADKIILFISFVSVIGANSSPDWTSSPPLVFRNSFREATE